MVDGAKAYWALVGGLVGLALGMLLGRFWLFAPAPLVMEVPTPLPPPPTPTPAPVVVYVSGAVQSPGVYTLPPGSRVADAVNAAGGFAEGAATAAINLALPLEDGAQVHIPAQGEAPRPAVTPTPAGASFPVDVNTASQEMLEAIPGIGPTMARRIIEGRPYGTVDDLLRVRGIGPATLEKLRPYVTVGE